MTPNNPMQRVEVHERLVFSGHATDSGRALRIGVRSLTTGRWATWTR
jgi:hypothetical protein